VSVADVQNWRDAMVARGYAPKTLNRRISSVSSFYRYLQAVAAEMRLPIVVPNPAHAQFIARSSTDPVDETQALSATRARQLMGLPQGDDVIARRDRAILKFYLYVGARLAAGCRLKVSDFVNDHEHATIRLTEKGGRRRTIGMHFAAAEAISEYISAAQITSGLLFRPRLGPTSRQLADKALSPAAMYRLVLSYLVRLPGAMNIDGNGRSFCLYTPHSLRATTATLLLNAGVDIRKVQELLGHRHVTTTQIYDKRRRSHKESASHDVPI
jgi:integrase